MATLIVAIGVLIALPSIFALIGPRALTHLASNLVVSTGLRIFAGVGRIAFGIALIVAATAAVIAPPLFERGPGPGGSSDDTVLLFTVWGMPFEDRLFEDVYADGDTALMPGGRA